MLIVILGSGVLLRPVYFIHAFVLKGFRYKLSSPPGLLKKYFYVLRSLLAIKWIERYKELASIVLDQLRKLVADDKLLDGEISKLLERKRVSLEKDVAPAITVLNKFIESELERLESYGEKSNERTVEFDTLDELFLEVLE